MEKKRTVSSLTPDQRRRLLTLEAAIRFAETTAKVAKDPARRFEAGERAADLRRDETALLLEGWTEAEKRLAFGDR